MRWTLVLLVVSGCSFTMHTVRKGGAEHCDDSYVSPVLDTVALAGAVMLTTWGAIEETECEGACYASGMSLFAGVLIGIPSLIATPLGYVRATECHRAKRSRAATT